MLVKDASIYEETTWYTEYAGEHPNLVMHPNPLLSAGVICLFSALGYYLPQVCTARTLTFVILSAARQPPPKTAENAEPCLLNQEHA